ncbi:MAG: flagellar basal-body rod protein FlgF [Pseudomonadota bacterium]|jgi:flagellar basal-body rod protein FlgG
MSIKGLYTAVSGAMAQNLRLETVANNLANVNTPGFKKDTQIFKEYLTANEKPPSVIQTPKVPASIESFYDMQGGDKSFVDSAGTYSDFSQGGLKATGNALDLALDGKGFFEIASPRGVKFTRNGSFSIDGQGQLVNKEGWPVLKRAEPGVTPDQRVIKIPVGAKLNVNENGEILFDGEVAAQISVIDLLDPDSLQKEGNSVFGLKENMNPQLTNVVNPQLRQGFVETSNVNIIQEMTDMISATRLFESSQKAIQAYDSMADKLVNVVPRSN